MRSPAFFVPGGHVQSPLTQNRLDSKAGKGRPPVESSWADAIPSVLTARISSETSTTVWIQAVRPFDVFSKPALSMFSGSARAAVASGGRPNPLVTHGGPQVELLSSDGAHSRRTSSLSPLNEAMKAEEAEKRNCWACR